MIHCCPMRVARLALLIAIGAFLSLQVFAVELSEAQRDFRGGKYAEVAKIAAEQMGGGGPSEDWAVLEIDALLAVGRYADANTALERSLVQFPNSLRLRIAGIPVVRMNN